MADLKGFVLSFLFCLLLQCAPSLQAESMVFVADYHEHAIFMADFSSDSLDSLTFNALPFSSVRYPMVVDYDPDTRMVYWSEGTGPIRRGNIDGTMQSVIVDSSSVGSPYGIALDTSRGKVFWTDLSLDRIMSANLDGSSQQILINTDIHIPYGIIIHKGEGLMFWTDLVSPGRIERANLDGGDRYVIVNSGIRHPYGLAFNAECSRVYWGDANTNKIESVDLWGNDRMVHLATSGIYPYDLAVIDDSIIWTDYNNGVLGVTSTNSSSGYSFNYDSIFQRPYGLHVYREEMPTTTEVYNPTTDQADPDSTTSPILTEAPSTEELPTSTEVYNPTTDQANPVRLVNGTKTHEGRVEVFYSGSWGTVCDDSWSINDARVVCRSLGYQDALSAPSQARFGQGSGPIWMDDVNCSGNEAHIFDCPHNGFGNHDCNHGEDASVVCLPDQADLTCDSVSMTLIMEKTLLEIGDDARDVHFEDESCVAYDHDSQHVAITTMYDRCGTTQEHNDDYIIFTNMVTYYKPRPENGTNELIAREHNLQIPVTCYLERTQVLEESFLPEANLYVFEEVGYGDFSLNLDRYTNPGFYQPVNDSGEVTLGTPLYFGVRLTSVTNLTLLIESCWATSSPDPRDDHRYDIIENGCAVDRTTVIFNWASPTFKGFSIDAFTFIGDYDKVYVHCSILICDNNDSGSRCAQGCLARSRRSLQPTGSRSKPHTITNGPLSDASRSQRAMLLDSVDDGPESHDPLMIVGVSALCVLIALTVVNALMKVRMRRPRPEQIGYRRVGVTEQD